MMSFLEWLRQIGLSHHGPVLLENGIDFDVVPDLTRDDLLRLGLNLGDSLRLLKARATLSPQGLESHTDTLETVDVVSSSMPAPRGEKRQLTVMFCDLVGSTALAGRLHDEEDYHDVIVSFRHACRKVVEQYDGYVAQYRWRRCPGLLRVA